MRMSVGEDRGQRVRLLRRAAREYVIARPDTPTPWINYIGEGRYGGIVSNTGGGYSFDRDPRNRRVTRYRYNAIPADQPGRYVYLRDQETGEYWSPTWQPVRRDLDSYECRHGAAYTRISSAYKGIAAEITYFVPLNPVDEPVPCELWVLRVRNTGTVARRLRSFTYAEFSFFDANQDAVNLDWAQHIVFSSCEDGIIRVRTKFNPLVCFFGSSYAADRLHVRPRGLRRPLPRSVRPDRRRDRRAVQRPVAARQQRGVAGPRHRACAGRGAPARLRHGCYRATS